MARLRNTKGLRHAEVMEKRRQDRLAKRFGKKETTKPTKKDDPKT